MPDSILDQLVWLSHELGREDRHLAILGEGNTSADASAETPGTFWVKGSGSQLGTIKPEQFSRVRTDRVLALLDSPAMGEAELDAALRDALVDPSHAKPSIETLLHAICLTRGGAKFVGHTHAEACNGFLCSKLGAEPFRGHIFPDAVVVCGRHPMIVAYDDPGLPIAATFNRALTSHLEKHGRPPKLALLVNHGIVALGQSAREALNITLMAEKWARILSSTARHGGPQFLADEQADRIDNRLDEHHRRRVLGASSPLPPMDRGGLP